ncbi:hypothetical protein F0365_13900 [Nonlabens sp. Ci31]|uniref:hypothetical protein n=1 Tax=Nonlabens sp. Ci31 TaxID=2608253 RepID=UPI001463471A|nr:hypothetical protein [Nonlabens sp. Ci31]QJP35414.1 hypothetical protein F0365_13900 [Nonlabens sp. Ci31]
MKKIPFLFLILVFISSCNFNAKINLPKKETAELKPFPKVERTTFENIFIVDENKCEKWNLPITRFKIEYPNNVKVDTAKIGVENYDYISFQVIENGVVIEELSIGYSDARKMFEKEIGQKTAEKTMMSLKQSLPDSKELFSGMAEFYGQENYLLNAEVKIENKTPQNFIGTYQMFKTHYYPNSTDLNPINISWTANGSSDIKKKADFGKNGLTSEIWKTFKFVEE